MKDELISFFREEKIEYFAALSYADTHVIAGEIMAREDFVPRSLLIYLLPYYAGEGENLSRYAIGRDYHLAIRGVGERLIQALGTLYPSAHAKSYGDHSPIDERHAALIAGLGIAGDNGLLLNEKYGSYIFIADVVTDIPPEELGAALPLPIRSCEKCGRCRAACPTGILRGEGSDCLSAITQRKGELTEDEIALMRRYHTVWGCDECQCHCPHNAHPARSPLPFFGEDLIPHLTTEILSSMDKAAFSERAYAWRGRKTVARNLALLGE